MSNGKISPTQALAMASSNIERLLGSGLDGDPDKTNSDLVATRGGAGDPFGFESKVVGVIAKRRGVVDLF